MNAKMNAFEWLKTNFNVTEQVDIWTSHKYSQTEIQIHFGPILKPCDILIGNMTSKQACEIQ